MAADGGVFDYGTADFYGSKGGQPLNAPIVGIAAAPTGKGYWEVAADGGIFNYGTAAFYGSMGGQPLNAPVVGIAATPTGKGYWEVAADGGIFSYGTAHFYGSKGGQPLNAPVVGIAATPTGKGYWEVASDGGIFSYGTANFYGSMGGQPLNAPVVGIAATPTGKGYWEVAADGGIFDYGHRQLLRLHGRPAPQRAGRRASRPPRQARATGRWPPTAGIFNYGTANFYGSKGGKPLNAPIVGITSTPLEVAALRAGVVHASRPAHSRPCRCSPPVALSRVVPWADGSMLAPAVVFHCSHFTAPRSRQTRPSKRPCTPSKKGRAVPQTDGGARCRI